MKRHMYLVLLAVLLVACGGTSMPEPGSTFSGPIDISGGASSGTFTFTVSDDGAAITFVGFSLTDVRCDGFSAGSWASQASGMPFPIRDGSINVSSSSIGEAEGRFTSPTEASGTIDLRPELSFGQTTRCELGEWEWSAEAH